MNSFLTLEDINTVLGKYGAKTLYHEISVTEECEDLKIDFCIVTKTSSNVSFKIVNENWTGAYYTLDSNGGYTGLTGSWDSSENTLSFNTSNDIILVLVCNPLASFNVRSTHFKLVDSEPIVLDYSEVSETVAIEYIDLSTGETSTLSTTLNIGVNNLSSIDSTVFVFLKKHDIEFNLLTTGLISGKKNTVHFDGLTLDEFDTDCVAYYLDMNVEFKLSDGWFIVDLTDYNMDSHIDLKVELLESGLVNGKIVEFKLPVEFIQVADFSNLYNEIVNGTVIVELSDDIQCLSRIPVSHDLIVYGDEHSLDLNEYGFDINEDVTFKLENTLLDNGDTAIKQGKNTNIHITNCTFTNCKSTLYNNLGSVLYCDVNLESLTDPSDFTTNIVNCNFINNHSCLFHGGGLSITDSKYHNTDTDYVDINNPAFLYQTDGNASIQNSVFDIDYTSDYFCSNQINIGFAQCLIMCGETAIINNANQEYISSNTLPFFETPYNNQSHAFCKYYYSKIETCVYTSPESGFEDKNVCYCVSNDDKVFKQNTLISRADMVNENHNRKIIWE